MDQKKNTEAAMSESNKKNSRERGFISQLNHDATLTGVVRSTFGNSRRGAAMVNSGVSDIVKTSKDLLLSGRIETFEQALERLGIEEIDLALIHNQIVAQTYVAFFVAMAALSMAFIYLVLDAQLAPGALSAVVAVTSIIYFFQSSVQTLQIRSRNLGLMSQLLLTPSQWFPSRISGLRTMAAFDPLRSPEVVRPMARAAQHKFGATLALVTLGVGLKLSGIEGGIGPWGTLSFIVASIVLFWAVGTSFDVFRRRVGLHCDVGLWLMSPMDWVPPVADARTDALRSISAQAGAKGANKSRVD